MAAIRNLIIDQGTTFSITVTITDNSGTVMDITGAVFEAEVKNNYDTLANNSFTIMIVGDPTTGIISLTMSDTDTSALFPGRYVWDCKMTLSGAVTRILEGIVTVTPAVSL